MDCLPNENKNQEKIEYGMETGELANRRVFSARVGGGVVNARLQEAGGLNLWGKESRGERETENRQH